MIAASSMSDYVPHTRQAFHWAQACITERLHAPGSDCLARPCKGIETPLLVLLTGKESLTKSDDLCADTSVSSIASFLVRRGTESASLPPSERI